MRRAAIVGVSLAATSCLLFTDLGAFDAVGADGADATSDGASPGDAGGGADVGLGDSSDSGADAGLQGCKASDAAFCADFDDGVLEGRWTEIEPSGGGLTLAISNAVARSPSSSLHSAIARSVINPPFGDCAYARARRDLADLGPRLRARFSFDAWLGPATGPAPSDAVLVANLDTQSGCNFIILLQDLRCGVVFQFPGDDNFPDPGLNAALPLSISQTWAHVELDVSFDPSRPVWSLFVNGQRCGVEKEMPQQCQLEQTLAVSPGVYCEDKGTGVAEVYLDNVEVR